MIFTLLLSLVAACAGFVLSKKLARLQAPVPATPADLAEQLRQAQTEADRLREKAKSDAKVTKDEVRESLAANLDRMAQDLKEIGERLDRKAEAVQLRETAVNERRQALQDREAVLKDRQSKLVPPAQVRSEIAGKVQRTLAERAGVDERELVAQLVEARLQDANLRASQIRLGAEERAKTESELQAKRIISISNERFNLSHQPDLESPGFRLSDPDIVKKVSTEPDFREAFAAQTKAELNLNDDGTHVDVRGVDPLAREMGRRTLVYMKNQGVLHVDRIPTVLQRVQKEVEKELDKACDRATRLLRIAPLTGEVRRLFGRLLYRASYSQNQWHHAVEVGYVCGLMAAELGLDVRTARRAGLLHDIGKAMSHDHEGSHALLGAEVARREGESEEIANAIAAHHGEEPNVSPYAEITAAGDAISGARPGARREITEAFNSKVHDLERIAYGVTGVQRVHVMQGGREVRVFVGEREIDASPVAPQTGWEAIYGAQSKTSQSQGGIRDEDMHPIARQIAAKVEEELTYPGQIRITVIRETRAVGVAR